MKKINVLFVSEQQLIIALLISFFTADPLISLDTKRFNNFNERYRIEVNKYDAVIYDDVALTGGENKKLNELLNQKSNQKNILFTERLEKNYIKRMYCYGVKSIVSQRSDVRKLREAIIKVFRGEEYFCDNIKECLYNRNGYEAVLTLREQEVLNYLYGGMGYKEIAEKLIISPKTVNRHIENIKNKIGVKSIKKIMQMLRA